MLKRRVKRDFIDLGPAPRSHRPHAGGHTNHTASSVSQFARVLHPMGISRRPLLEPMSSETPSSSAADHGPGGPHLMIGSSGGDLDLGTSSSNLNPVPSPLPPFNSNRAGANNNNNNPTVSNLSGSNSQEININGSFRPATTTTTTSISSAASGYSGSASVTPQFQFNDPSWSQMWYLVSAITYTYTCLNHLLHSCRHHHGHSYLSAFRFVGQNLHYTN